VSGTNASKFVDLLIAVQNSGGEPVIGLKGILIPLGYSFELRALEGDLQEVNATHPLYTNEVAANESQGDKQQLSMAEQGKQYSMVIEETFSDGSSSNLTTAVIAQPFSTLPAAQCNFQNVFQLMSQTVVAHNSTRTINWSVTLKNRTGANVTGLVASMGSLTTWTQFSFNSKPPSSANPLPVNDTAMVSITASVSGSQALVLRSITLVCASGDYDSLITHGLFQNSTS
jgi:hypothetical protein